MSYTPPSVDSTGVTIPSYTDIVNSLVASAQSIYGSDIYLGNDSQDYQMISAFAAMVNDSNLLLQAVYNTRSPATALGAGLDAVVAINGISRLAASPSTASMTLNGTANTTITGGLVQDANGNNWSLPSPTIIGSNGTVTVTATCQTSGAISAPAGTITTIVTPTLGWASVTNATAATVGTAQETDSQLRSRQAISTAQPSQTVLEGLEGALASLADIAEFQVYENATNTTNTIGIPANSISVVVEGGTPQEIGNAIWSRKTPGCGTFGTSTVAVTDQYGVVTPINYFAVSYTQIMVAYTVEQLTNYTTDTTAAIQAAAAAYVTGLPIGGELYLSGLWGAALGVNSNPSSPTFSVVNVQAAVNLGAELTSALASGTTYTSLSVSSLLAPVASGAALVIGSGTTAQTITASAAASIGATSIPVTSFVASTNYAVNTPVAFPLGSSDIPIAFNFTAQATAADVTVTVQ
jgi:uncharacterized phage protein gp47/JayE